LPRRLGDFARIVAEETTTAGVVARMVERYPGWKNPRTLWYSAGAAIKRSSILRPAADLGLRRVSGRHGFGVALT